MPDREEPRPNEELPPNEPALNAARGTEEIFRELSALIARRLAEGREAPKSRSGESDVSLSIQEELDLLKEMIRKDEEAHHEHAPDPPPETSADMSEGLRLLFRGQRPAETETAAPPTPDENAFFDSFLRGLSEMAEPLAFGLNRLDDLLDGGLYPGLYVIGGPAGSGGRPLLLNMLWKTVAEGKRCRYYCLSTGSQAIWEEMVVTLSHLLDDKPLTLAELRRPGISTERIQQISSLNQGLGHAFMQHVTLVEQLPPAPVPLAAFLREAVGGATGSPPDLLLLDGLQQLLILLGLSTPMEAGSLLLELDGLLRGLNRPALLLSEWTAGPSGRWEERGLEHLASGLLLTRRRRRARERATPAGMEPLSVRVIKQPRGLAQGTVPLVLDTDSGVIAEAPDRSAN